MTAQTTTQRPVSRADAASMIFFMLAGIAIAAGSVVAAWIRIAEVLPGTDVPVLAEFAGTMADAPIGPDGAPVPVELATAYITAPRLPAASVAALVAQPLVASIAVVTVVACLLLVTWNMLRGRIFSRVNTALVTTAGMTGLVAYGVVPGLGNMGANGAFAEVSDRTFANVVGTVDVSGLFLVAFVAATATLVFTVGDRLRRDTEGLI
ncbi:hypothetical protein [Microbacterium sp. CFBP9034]|uniref:hypothetical protein n=1 Tax=Microbacterium sp. CFBP9034 TaxID=3096540 RepID=UPI002A6A07C9|nr:hypothetical protein [Microbacterium sp. CFBP9034]MDY0907882.1 hypothetical protein [Microbacterium sp. CFBP9034]